AEDGLRDFHVTGVQTCALPISFPIRAAWLWRLHKRSALVCASSVPLGPSASPWAAGTPGEQGSPACLTPATSPIEQGGSGDGTYSTWVFSPIPTRTPWPNRPGRGTVGYAGSSLCVSSSASSSFTVNAGSSGTCTVTPSTTS